ncbi:hypothetical protein ACLB1R_23020 [Escherichia coli]
MLSNRIAGLGLSIMAVGGYARYMERIGASRAMVSLLSRPLKLIRSPYIILVGNLRHPPAKSWRSLLPAPPVWVCRRRSPYFRRW